MGYAGILRDYAGVAQDRLGDGAVLVVLVFNGGFGGLLSMDDLMQGEGVLDKDAGVYFRLLDAIGYE